MDNNTAGISINKEKLKTNIKKWIDNDNEIRILNKELLIRKKINKELTESLISIIQDSNIDTFDLKDGSIRYVRQNVKKSISKKYLFDVLNRYYENSAEALQVNNFILENIEETIKEKIIRKINPSAAIDRDNKKLLLNDKHNNNIASVFNSMI
jgi:methionine salvage enolase-phosphatase E1